MIRRTLLGSGTLRALALAGLVLIAAVAAVVPTVARAQSGPVAQAQSQYDAGNFAGALATLETALASGTVTGSDALAARQLLGRCQAKVGDVPAARKTFLGILRQDPQFRLDEVTTPPDEIAVFREALRMYEAEQEEASRRLPASLSGFIGIGSGKNENFGEYVASGGGDKEFENKPMFGLSVRFPLRPRLSLELEVMRFHATNEDSVTGPGQATYQASALPVVANLVYLLTESGKLRTSLFAGGGPMVNSYLADEFLFFGVLPLNVSDTKVGTYFHGGLEGEYVMHPRLSLTARALVRSAKATGMFEGSTFTQYGGTETLGDREVDFSGFGLSIGLRGYIGY